MALAESPTKTGSTITTGHEGLTVETPRIDSRDAGRKHSTADDSEQLDGTIKWYNRRKSYGFIVDSSGEEIFFHQQELELVNGKPPMVDKGLSVKFHKTLTEKGPQAQRVRIVE